MRAAMKRNTPNFTSGQFSALRRGAHLASATGSGNPDGFSGVSLDDVAATGLFVLRYASALNLRSYLRILDGKGHSRVCLDDRVVSLCELDRVGDPEEVA
jgi:hypothetical protein